MTSPVTNRQFLLELAKATLDSFHSEPSPLEIVSDVHPDAVKNSLQSALDWARLEAPASIEESVAPASAAEPYIPSNQTLSLLQSAYDEYIESRGITEVPFDPSDPGWKTIAQEKLKATSRGKHPFIPHANLDSFRIDLPADAVVALFSDWGTGEASPQRVMQQIAATHPTHAIHLGDVYYAGTPSEAQEPIFVPRRTPLLAASTFHIHDALPFRTQPSGTNNLRRIPEHK